MALTLAESAKLSQNNLQRGVIETFVQESRVLDRIPLLPIAGNAYAYNEEATLPGVEFRAVNSAYSESTGTINQKTESLVILGGDADVDRFIVQTRGNLNDQRAIVTRSKVKALSFKYQDAFINGDVAVDANSFDGLKKRLTGGQVIDTATNGIPVLGADDAARQLFLDSLDALIAAVPGGPDALYMNTAIRSKLLSCAAPAEHLHHPRRGQAGAVVQRHSARRHRDQVGRHGDHPGHRDAGHQHRLELDLRRQVRPRRVRPGRHRPDQRRRVRPRPRRAGLQAGVPHPHRVLLRARDLRPRRSAPARRPQRLANHHRRSSAPCPARRIDRRQPNPTSGTCRAVPRSARRPTPPARTTR
jgi:hypothetical protein